MAETFGEAVRRLRDACDGTSLRKLAKLAAIDPGHLSRIENSKRPPSRQIAAALDQALGADGALVNLAGCATTDPPALAGDGWARADAEALAGALLTEQPSTANALRLAHEWLVTDPPQVYEMRAGRRIGSAIVEQIGQRVHQMRLLDDHVGGLDTYKLVTDELNTTLELLRQAAYTEPVGRRLLAAIGELCQLAGYVAVDAGRPREATRRYLTGVRAAHAGGELPGAANNLSSLAYLIANTADPREGALMAASADCGARHEATATTRALLLERVAWTQARAGEPAAVDRALGRAEQVYSGRQPANDPIWVYWLTEDEIAIMAGRCWTQLHRPLRAVPILEEATQGYGEDTPRESALYLTWLAEAYLQANEVEQAAEVAMRALELARHARSERTTARLTELRALFAPYRGVPVVDALEEASGDRRGC